MIYKYKHMEEFEHWRKPDLNMACGKIILYGAGRRGAVAAHSLKQRNIDFLCFVDTDPSKCGKEYCGKMVITPEELYEKYYNYVIIVTTSCYYAVEIELKKHNVLNYYSCVHIYNGTELDDFNMYSLEYTIRNLDLYYHQLTEVNNENSKRLTELYVMLTYNCTLRCRECSAYVPYEKGCNDDFDCEKTIQAIQKLAQAYDYIDTVSLLGGEPFIYKKLEKLLREVVKIKNIERISLITNGTIVPDKVVFNILKGDNRFYVRISDYGSLSTKKAQLCNLLQDNKVEYELTDYATWNKVPILGKENTDTINEKIKNCCAQGLSIYLIENKIFICPLLAYGSTRNILPSDEISYLDTQNYNCNFKLLYFAVEKYREDFRKGIPKAGCKYCVYDVKLNYKRVAEQTNERLIMRCK